MAEPTPETAKPVTPASSSAQPTAQPNPPPPSVNAPYGLLNPISKSLVGPALDPSTTTFFGTAAQTVTRSTREDVLSTKTIYKAIVLYAWKTQLAQPFSPPTETITIKARIPELDTISIPRRLPVENNPNDEKADWATINLYPTYLAKDTAVTAMGMPQPGTIIWVSYGAINAEKREAGIYLGPINVDAMPSPDAFLSPPEVVFTEGAGTLGDLGFGFPGGPPIFNLKGNWSRGLDKQRVLYLSQKLQLDPNIVAAFQMVESAGNPTVFAWNAHVMRKRLIFYHGKNKGGRLLNKARAVGLADHKAKATSSKAAGFGQPRSVYKKKAQRLFDLAYRQVDPKAAVAGGAWGNYQVLGLFAFKYIDYIKNSPNPPAEVLKRFKEDPAKFSDDMLVAWVKGNGGIGGKWWKAASSTPPNYAYIVTRYYGGRSLKYISKLSTYHRQFLKEGTFRALAGTQTQPTGGG